MAEQDEKSWWDEAQEWVHTQASEPDQQPVAVETDELTAEELEQARWQAELGEYIDSVCGHLKLEVDAAYQQGNILLATSNTSTREEFEAFTGQCAALSVQGYTAASQLVAAGVQEWVYSVKACNEVGHWATSASGHAGSAATSESPTEIHGFLGSAVEDLQHASASINGA
ncbi:hypothetical protein [Actinophytocola sp.]|uniref:hypothetical protein n=1 Tax=Actinophytocola sp. TaxID=1872138 RepID=UPI002D80E112|nr:hypothetical protein [Actinophytocola sp.]HET9140855.1 hypothetical protein [Actinophytocola sp.]